VKKVMLVFGAILILLSGVMVGCDEKQPPDERDMVRYVQHDWQIDASSEEIRQVLSLEDLMSGDDFSSEIGGILTVISMKKDMDKGEYAEAAQKGAKWLIERFLTESEFSWLSSYVTLGKIAYELYDWIYYKFGERAFNAQVKYYLIYREDWGMSEEEIKREVVVGGYLRNPEGAVTVAPSGLSAITGKYTLEDIFKVGNAFLEAKRAEKYRARDEEKIKSSFVATLEQLREGKPTPPSTTTPTLYPKGRYPINVSADIDYSVGGLYAFTEWVGSYEGRMTLYEVEMSEDWIRIHIILEVREHFGNIGFPFRPILEDNLGHLYDMAGVGGDFPPYPKPIEAGKTYRGYVEFREAYKNIQVPGGWQLVLAFKGRPPIEARTFYYKCEAGTLQFTLNPSEVK